MKLGQAVTRFHPCQHAYVYSDNLFGLKNRQRKMSNKKPTSLEMSTISEQIHS